MIRTDCLAPAALAAAIALVGLPGQAALFHLNFCGTYTDGSGGVDGCVFYESDEVMDAALNFGLREGGNTSGGFKFTEIRSTNTAGNATFSFDEFVEVIEPTMNYAIDSQIVTWPEEVKGWRFDDTETPQSFLAVFPVEFLDNPVNGAEVENELLTLVLDGSFVKDADKIRNDQVVPVPLPLALLLTGLGGLGLLGARGRLRGADAT